MDNNSNYKPQDSKRASFVQDSIPGSRRHSHPGPGPEPSAVELVQLAAKSGWLHKRGGGNKSKAWKKRWFSLSGQVLYYFKSEKERKAQGSVQPLREYIVEEDVDSPRRQQFEFRLTPRSGNGRVYAIFAATQMEKVDWMEALRYACEGSAQTKLSLEIEEKLRRNCYDIPPGDLEWDVDASGLLGKGASGVVRRGVWLKTTEVAVKGLNNLPEFTDEEEMVGFYKEIETLSQLRHPNIVPMFGYCKKDGYLCLVTEYVKGGDLSRSIHSSDSISLHLKVELCISICRGLVFLHNKKVIHRDLKPQNILVESLWDARVKVCDFGLSTIKKGNEKDLDKGGNTYGSPSYAAPELANEQHTSKVDVFSFGVIMWEIYTRQMPWSDDPTLTHAWQIADRVLKGIRLNLPEAGILNHLMVRCWDQNPDKRPTFPEIYEELDKVKSKLPPQQPDTNPRNSQTLPSGRLSAESRGATRVNSSGDSSLPVDAQLLEAFGDQPSIAWDDFIDVIKSVYRTAPLGLIQKLQWVLGRTGSVDRHVFKTFLEWFQPLSLGEGAYQTKAGTKAQVPFVAGYDFSQIMEIVGNNWFFGFMTAAEAKDALQDAPYGTYLFRFSSNAGCYALSVNYGSVGHWRITTEKNGSEPPVFRIDGRNYRNLFNIIETHAVGGDALTVKGSPNVQSCFLKLGLDREGDDDDPGLYEAMYETNA